MGQAVRAALWALAVFLPALTARAAPALQDGGWAVVRQVADGNTVVLADGRTVRLIGIEAPLLGVGGQADEPFARAARTQHEALVLERNVHLMVSAVSAAVIDRYGLVHAHLYDGDGRWVQGELVASGLARVHSLADNRALVPELLAIEGEARQAGRGLWGDRRFAVLAPEQAGGHLNAFAIVEGRVLAADVVDGRTYLNFGPDYRTDFTASISAQDARVFRAEGIDLRALAGRTVRVRGWLYPLNGPMMDVTHPEQIELLER